MSKLKRRLQVQELLFSGFTHEKISQKLEISTKTVTRDIQWIRENSQNWLEDLAGTNYAHIFRETLEGYKQDIMRLYEMLEKCEDDNTKIRIIKTISDLRYRYTEQLGKFPAVWAMDVFVLKNSPHSIELPSLPSLLGTTGMVK